MITTMIVIKYGERIPKISSALNLGHNLLLDHRLSSR